MSPEAQQIAIAEACGPRLFVIRKPIYAPFDFYRPNGNGYTGNINEAWKVTEDIARQHVCGSKTTPDRVIMEPAPIPDYLSDLNAMYEAEETLIFKSIYLATVPEWFGHLVKASGNAPHSKAYQRAEAVLRTIGKWEESS